MRRLRSFGLFVSCVFLLFLALWVLAPAEAVDREIQFSDKALPADLDAYLAAQELQFSDIRPGAAKRIRWAGTIGARTPLAVIYVHGFSASAEEIRPVPDRVAAALGANLYFTRLAGHGRTGAAMAEPTAGDWIEDMAEAMAIGRRLGDRVVVIATSTGATLAALAATDSRLAQDLAGVVLISPNFRLRATAAAILDAPFARFWGPLVAGDTRSFTPKNQDHAAHWTTSYPTLALFSMAALMREARGADYSRANVPALFIYSRDDQVIDPSAIAPVRDAWAGPVAEDVRQMGPADDPYSHVIAGDILSPGQTAAVSARIIQWAGGL